MDLKSKYKERKPEDTVKIIKSFFIKKGFDLEVPTIGQSESGTWHCEIMLYHHGEKILNSFGKGTTKNFCLASGCAELYERFCNMCGYINNFIFSRNLRKYNKIHFGYNYDPNEKIINAQDILNIPIYNEVFSNYMGENKNKLLDFLTDNEAIGVPFKKFGNENEIHYHDLRLLSTLYGSNGLSAGNTEEEALNQAISEIIERACMGYVFEKTPSTFYALDLTSSGIIKNLEIKKYIEKIQDLGNKLIIFDLSYNFNYPVIMLLLLNKRNKSIITNFGAHPVFDIALERTITEIYQGIDSFNKDKSWIMSNMNENSYDDYLLVFGNNSTNATMFPYKFLENIIYKETFNKEVFFTEENYSSQDFLDYWLNICKRDNLEIFYRNSSLIPEMTAISVICYNLYPDIGLHAYAKKVPEDVKANTLKRLQQEFRYCDISSIDDLLSYFMINEYLETDDVLSGCITRSDISPYKNIDNKVCIFAIINNILSIPTQQLNFSSVLNVLKDTFYFKNAKEIFFFLQQEENSKKLLKKFFETEKFYDYASSIQLTNAIFIEPLLKEIDSEEYKDFLSNFHF